MYRFSQRLTSNYARACEIYNTPELQQAMSAMMDSHNLAGAQVDYTFRWEISDDLLVTESGTVYFGIKASLITNLNEEFFTIAVPAIGKNPLSVMFVRHLSASDLLPEHWESKEMVQLIATMNRLSRAIGSRKA